MKHCIRVLRVWLLLMAVLVQSHEARAWVYVEHQALGKIAYVRACEYVTQVVDPCNRGTRTRVAEFMRRAERTSTCSPELNGDGLFKQLDHDECGERVLDTATFDKLSECLVEPELLGEFVQAEQSYQKPETQVGVLEALQLACGNLGAKAMMFGQYNALSGDHIGIGDLGTIGAGIAARNILGELVRAVKNADHFHPQAPQVWAKHHANALSRMLDARVAPNHLKRLDLFMAALAEAAFAGHFLQDAFSTGHGGTNRPGSAPTAARQYHNYWNDAGRLLRDQAGRVWFGFGDERLCGPTSSDAREVETCVKHAQPTDYAYRPLKATEAAVRDLLLTFITGYRSQYRETYLVDQIPVFSKACDTVNECRDAVLAAGGASKDLDQYAACTDVFPTRVPAQEKAGRDWVQRCSRAYLVVKGRYESRTNDHFRGCYHGLGTDCWNLGIIQAHAGETYSLDLGLSSTWVPNEFDDFAVGPRLGVTMHFAAAGLDVVNVRLEAGAMQATESNNWSLLGATQFSVPIGYGYGSVLAPELILFRMAITGPVQGEALIQREWWGGGLAVEAELGEFGLVFYATANAVHSRALAAGSHVDAWNFGLDTAVSLVLAPTSFLGEDSVHGGGPNEPPPF